MGEYFGVTLARPLANAFLAEVAKAKVSKSEMLRRIVKDYLAKQGEAKETPPSIISKVEGGESMGIPSLVGLKRRAYGVLIVDKTGQVPPNFHSIWFAYYKAVRTKEEWENKEFRFPELEAIVVDVTIEVNRIVPEEVESSEGASTELSEEPQVAYSAPQIYLERR